MKLIIHVGPPKTGTTALQRALFSSRESLLKNSILYPDPKLRKLYNHGRLCYLFRPFSEAPRGMKQRGEADYIKRGEFLRDQIVRQTRTHAPEMLILSSEWFARAYQAKDASKFVEFAESLGASSIEFLLYARRPSDFFLSASQQRLRAASHFEPIYPWNVNELIDGFRALAPQHTVTARAFDHNAFVGGSIITDFATHYIPGCKEVLNQAQTPRQSNESFSAEAMVILQDFRRTFFSDQEDRFNDRTRKLMRRLQKLDAREGNPRPKLKPDWKDYLDYGNDRALRLRDGHGIEFSDFDYARLERRDFAGRPERSENVADGVTTDPDRLWRMVGILEQSFWSPTRKSAAWLRDLSGRIGRAGTPDLPFWRGV